MAQVLLPGIDSIQLMTQSALKILICINLRLKQETIRFKSAHESTLSSIKVNPTSEGMRKSWFSEAAIQTISSSPNICLKLICN